MLNKPCKEFGEFIVFNREGSGLSEEKFAILLNTSVSFIKRLERGKVHPTDTLINEISRILGVPFDELKMKIWCDPPGYSCPSE